MWYKVLFILVLSLMFLQYLFITFKAPHPLTQRNFYGSIYTDPVFATSLMMHNETDVLNLTASTFPQENETIPMCPVVPPGLIGFMPKVPVIMPPEKIHTLPGGQWRPEHCRSRDRVAIIIPYKDRVAQLATFLTHMHPILQRQLLDYGIFVVEQAGTDPFNRAMLFNVGYRESLKLREFDCFIFHDVDLIPEDDRNLYTCPHQNPRHMSVALKKFNYRLPYPNLFGGVSAMSRDQFEGVNGFSNIYWGWGGEDDDMANRIKKANLTIDRYPANIARYTMLSHKKQKANPQRFKLLYSGEKRFSTDGLSSLKYRTLQVRLKKLFTWILVELTKT